VLTSVAIDVVLIKTIQYITWINDNRVSWTLRGEGLGPNPAVRISARPVPQEPMVNIPHSPTSPYPPEKQKSELTNLFPHLQYIIANLGISKNFGFVDFEHLTFPSSMHIDYVRVYQPSDAVNIGCDPKDFPTQAYINSYVSSFGPQVFEY
jgi:hypothetical protein